MSATLHTTLKTARETTFTAGHAAFSRHTFAATAASAEAATSTEAAASAKAAEAAESRVLEAQAQPEVAGCTVGC
ncbi:MAG: hypothetical protein M3347_11660 [Armatimonadota bacterium]|nr:hypothetical protein [Armatimonadota bacterium]